MHEKTLVIKKPLEEMYYYKYMTQLIEFKKKYTVEGIIESFTPMYITVTNSKFECIE